VNPELRVDDIGSRCGLGVPLEGLDPTRANLRRAGLP
jgi:hypothetical protein